MAKLVAIGDSLAQGAQNLAITNTHQSFPAQIANCMGLPHSQFLSPNFKGQGGLPFNLEWMARKLQALYGNDISYFEWAGSAYHITKLLDDVEDYWERGKGSRPVANALYHNLGIWNFEVCDTYTTTPRLCDQIIKRDKDEWFEPPSHARARIARRTLNPQRIQSRQDDTQIEVAKRIKTRDGEIENLILMIGANNCLRTSFTLQVLETGVASPGPGSPFTLWSIDAFEEEYEKMAREIDIIGAKNIYVGTVPHVTILPVIRGVMADGNPLPQDKKYYDYYARAWSNLKKFDFNRDPHLSSLEAKAIDTRIDHYNQVVRQVANKRGWQVVDICKLIDDLAYYRNFGKPKFQLPDAIKDLDTRFTQYDDTGLITQGGLFSLDGMHPSTCGYGLMAQAFIDVMKEKNPTMTDLDFELVRANDSLITAPPKTVKDLFNMLTVLEKHFHLTRWMSMDDEHGLHLV